MHKELRLNVRRRRVGQRLAAEVKRLRTVQDGWVQNSLRFCDLHAAALLAFFERVHRALCAAAMRTRLKRNLAFVLFG